MDSTKEKSTYPVSPVAGVITIGFTVEVLHIRLPAADQTLSRQRTSGGFAVSDYLQPPEKCDHSMLEAHVEVGQRLSNFRDNGLSNVGYRAKFHCAGFLTAA